MRIKKLDRSEVVKIIKYSISGGAFFWTGYAVFALCDKGFHFNLWWSKLIANIAGVTVNFILQRWWVFKGKEKRKNINQVSGRYIALTLVNFLIDYFIVYGLKVIGISPYIGQFVSAGFFTVWNYLWYRLWVFARIDKKRKLKKARA